MLRPRLARPGRTLRLLDVAPLTAGPGEEAIQASVTDLDAMTAACQGADAVIHLAGIPGEASWPRILEININGGYGAFEAARRAGTPRVIFASSNHAVGFAPRAAFPVPDYAFPAPDTYYGVSKVATEAHGRDVPLPVRPGRHLRAHPVLLPAAGERPDAVDLAVPGRRRPALRGVPDRRAARVPGHLRGLGQHPRRLGLAGRGPGPGLPAAGRRGGLRRRGHRRAAASPTPTTTRCSATWAASSPSPTRRSPRRYRPC